MITDAQKGQREYKMNINITFIHQTVLLLTPFYPENCRQFNVHEKILRFIWDGSLPDICCSIPNYTIDMDFFQTTYHIIICKMSKLVGLVLSEEMVC